MITDQTPRVPPATTQQQLANTAQRLALAGMRLGYKHHCRHGTAADWRETIDLLKGKRKSEPEALRPSRLASRRKRETA